MKKVNKVIDLTIDEATDKKVDENGDQFIHI